MYPFHFRPLFQRYIWGGHKLSRILSKPTGLDAAAESWEIADHDQFQSIVENGSLTGKTLGELMQTYGSEIVGAKAFDFIHQQNVPDNLRGRFPLLLKYLDANENLSVQVHPNDSLAANLPTADLGKTEAWYVMHAEPGARIYAGLKQGVSPSDFQSALQKQAILEILHSFEPKVGDCIFIPAGTVHAIGAGLLIAEIQQASNTTFRVYDWDRIDATGNARPLHTKQATQAIDFSAGPVNPESPQTTHHSNKTILIDCEKFCIHRWSTQTKPAIVEIGFESSFHALMVTQGSIKLLNTDRPETTEMGQTVLLPAALQPTTIELQPESEFLQIFLPEN